MLDPRLSIIDERLRGINRLIAISSGKGGVGKSLIAATSALILAETGFRAGLLDLDFTNPSSSVILGAGSAYPIEDRGVVPPKIAGVEYVSITFFTGDKPSPLRGEDLTNAFIEVLALTKWSSLDYLILDTPPGLSDLLLDLLRLVKRLSFLIVTTPSKLAFETVRKLMNLLEELRIPIIGIVENMKIKDSQFIRQKTENREIPYLGEIPFDSYLEDAIGDVSRLLETTFAKKIGEIVEKIVNFSVKNER